MTPIFFATGNVNKFQEAQAILGGDLQQIDIDLPEFQTLSVEEVVAEKAKAAYQQVGKPVLVEDTGLFFDAWHGFPGALIKWMMKTVNNQGILDMLTGFTDRKVTAVCCVGMYDGQRLISATGSIEGTASLTVRGDTRFARDQIFIPDGYDQTFAEMSPEEKNKISMRKIAFEKMKTLLVSTSTNPFTPDPKNAAHRVSLKCICIAENKVLMLHLIDKRWSLVGGGIDEGDDILSAMKREFLEETGNVLDNSIIPQLVHTEIKQFSNPGKFSAVLNIFYALHFDKTFEVQVEEGVYEEYKWCTLEEALALETSDHFNKDVLKRVLS